MELPVTSMEMGGVCPGRMPTVWQEIFAAGGREYKFSLSYTKRKHSCWFWGFFLKEGLIYPCEATWLLLFKLPCFPFQISQMQQQVHWYFNLKFILGIDFYGWDPCSQEAWNGRSQWIVYFYRKQWGKLESGQTELTKRHLAGIIKAASMWINSPMIL